MQCPPLILFLLAVGPFFGPVAIVGAEPTPPNFDREIAPLLVRRCLDCHSGPKPKGKLDLSRRKAALNLVTPGKPDESTLY